MSCHYEQIIPDLFTNRSLALRSAVIVTSAFCLYPRCNKYGCHQSDWWTIPVFRCTTVDNSSDSEGSFYGNKNYALK